MVLKNTDLVKDQFYHIHETYENEKHEVVFVHADISKADDDRIEASCYVSTYHGGSYSAGWLFITDRHCRLATEEEIKWLSTCCTLKKYLQKNKVNEVLMQQILLKIKQEIGI